jgi:hypothetical protein
VGRNEDAFFESLVNAVLLNLTVKNGYWESWRFKR